MQTGGPDNTPGASDGIFVFMGDKPSPAVGASVEVTGRCREFSGTTQISPSFAATSATMPRCRQWSLGNVIPGTDCALPGTDCPTGAAAERDARGVRGRGIPAHRRLHRHRLLRRRAVHPASRLQMQGEIGLAAKSDIPLMIPTETIDQSDTAALAAAARYNDAHRGGPRRRREHRLYATPTTRGHAVPVAHAEPPGPGGRPGHVPEAGDPRVPTSDPGGSCRRPRSQVGGTARPGRDREHPDPSRLRTCCSGIGDLKIATFNMLNYFNTYGETWAASDGNATAPSVAYNFDNPRRCSFFTDRGRGAATGTRPDHERRCAPGRRSTRSRA